MVFLISTQVEILFSTQVEVFMDRITLNKLSRHLLNFSNLFFFGGGRGGKGGEGGGGGGGRGGEGGVGAFIQSNMVT